MNRKNAPRGTPLSMARAAVENFEIALAIRAGRLTRALFEEWYRKREAAGTMVVTLRRPARKRRRHAARGRTRTVREEKA
jgi:hypothetical protein